MATRNDKVFVVSGKGSSLPDMLWFSWGPGSGTTYPINDYKTPITDHPDMGGNKFDVQEFEKWKNNVKPVKAKKIYAGVMEIYEIPLYPFLTSKDRVEYSSYSTPMARYDIYDVNSSSNQSEHIPENSIIKPIGKVYCIYAQQKYVFIHFFKTKNEAMGWFNSTMSANESESYNNEKPTKHVHNFENFLNEAKMSASSIVSQLENLDEMVKDSLKIDSAEPVYQNAAIRYAWTNQVAEGVKKIGVDEIKKNWKKIYSELENDNYHQLNLFLGLALKVDPKFVASYESRSKNPMNRDADAIRDFLKVNL